MKPLFRLLFFLCLILNACTSPSHENETQAYHRHVGDIPFDPELDDPAFQPCHEDIATQYYGFGDGIQYEGEKARIIRVFREKYTIQDKPEENGYITIRFMVNCKGETGRFRMEEMDHTYEPKTFSPEIPQLILEIVQSLDAWKPGTYQDRTYDYYQPLTFKIINGKISEIIP